MIQETRKSLKVFSFYDGEIFLVFLWYVIREVTVGHKNRHFNLAIRQLSATGRSVLYLPLGLLKTKQDWPRQADFNVQGQARERNLILLSLDMTGQTKTVLFLNHKVTYCRFFHWEPHDLFQIGSQSGQLNGQGLEKPCLLQLDNCWSEDHEPCEVYTVWLQNVSLWWKNSNDFPWCFPA